MLPTPAPTAAPWGGPLSPPNSCITIATFQGFLASIAASDDIECVQSKVVQRNEQGAFQNYVNLSYLEQFVKGQDTAGLAYEIVCTLYANHGPMGLILVNAYQLMEAWDAALEDTTGVQMQALITWLFTGVNYANYLLNKTLWQTTQSQSSPPQPPPVAGPTKLL
jgi:hypothetical protein